MAFTNRGARLVSWTLARYRDARGPSPRRWCRRRRAAVRPLDVETGDPAIDARLREALFQPSAESRVRVRGREPADAALHVSPTGGLEAEKTLRFPRRRASSRVTVSVKRDGQPLPVTARSGARASATATPEERDVRGYQAPARRRAPAGAGVERFPAAKLPPAGQPLDGVRWVGIESHYFAALFVAAGGRRERRGPAGDPAPRADEKP